MILIKMYHSSKVKSISSIKPEITNHTFASKVFTVYNIPHPLSLDPQWSVINMFHQSTVLMINNSSLTNQMNQADR